LDRMDCQLYKQWAQFRIPVNTSQISTNVARQIRQMVANSMLQLILSLL